MRWKRQRYLDQLGNRWSVRVHSPSGNQTLVWFRSHGLRLVADGVSADAGKDLPATRLKELFCDADRMVNYRGEQWRVGFRRRVGMALSSPSGMNTWFTSPGGEVRYVQEMLQFRQMTNDELCSRLASANPVTGGAVRVDWKTL